MKRGFQVHGSLDLIQPNDLWDCNTNGLRIPHHIPVAKTDMPDSHYAGIELSEFMDHVVRQLSEPSHDTTMADGLLVDSVSMEYFAPTHGVVDYRPRKSARYLYNSGASGGGSTTEKCEDSANKAMSKGDEHGLTMITLLMECAVAISVENLEEANKMILELTLMASPYSTSSAERVVAYFTRAMAARIMSSWLGDGMYYKPIVPYKSILSAFQAFNSISPFIKFAHFTANQAILEAFNLKDRVHIIDLDIMQGLQWPALFHILATRADGPPHVRMTGMGSSAAALEETGRQLSSFARRLGLPFEFHPIAKKPGDVDLSLVQPRNGETIAIHLLQHSLYDATGSDWKTMKLLELLSPRVITLVEQEMLCTGSFLDRFVGSLHYYSTIFDALGASLLCDDVTRHRVEHGLLLREISNILAVGGPGRGEEEKFGSWRAELTRRGFAQLSISGNSMAQAQLILNMFPPSHGYTIMQGDGTLRLGWKETGLYTASAWTLLPEIQ